MMTFIHLTFLNGRTAVLAMLIINKEKDLGVIMIITAEINVHHFDAHNLFFYYKFWLMFTSRQVQFVGMVHWKFEWMVCS